MGRAIHGIMTLKKKVCSYFIFLLQKEELKQHMFVKDLEQLELAASSSIGYTFKCLGAGFWAFKQKDFREAITKLTMEVPVVLPIGSLYILHSG